VTAANARASDVKPGAIWHPEAATRLANWHAIARQHITPEACMRFARDGFPRLAAELMRQRGDLP
jgi:hypothetical protein